MASGAGSASRAATQEPCDIYAAGGTPCVAAHSTTRALYAAYSGPLYQVRRSSDNATTNISPLSAGGVANAATQDSFCSGTSCVITEIFDQSGNGNNLTDAPGGGAAGGPDGLASATAAPVTVGGQKAYGVFIAPGDGYRDDSTRNIATGDNSESEYAIFDGTHFNGGCCFDYGNAETNNNDDGAGTMEAIYFGNIKVWGFGSGNGPWIMADMENGLFSGTAVHLNSNDPTTNFRFTTAMIEGGQNQWAILGGNAQSGGLATDFSGAAALGLQPDEEAGRDHPRHRRRQQQGRGRHLLRGRHDHRLSRPHATEAAVQANIVAAGYNTGGGGGGATGPITSGANSAKCVDDSAGSTANGNKIQMWDCQSGNPNQQWTVASNGTLQVFGKCLDITGASTANGALVELWDCNGGGNQQWQASNGALVNPASGKCLDDPNFNTANGTQLELWTCNGGTNQQWHLP